jgi:hypothetical protein
MARVVAQDKAAAAATAALSTVRGDGSRERDWEGDDDIHVRRGKEGGLSTVLQNG